MHELGWFFVLAILFGLFVFRAYKLGTEKTCDEVSEFYIREIRYMQNKLNFIEYEIDRVTTENKLLKNKLKEFENG